MKKLKDLKLGALKDVLNKDQMRKLTGGYGPTPCIALYGLCDAFNNPQHLPCCFNASCGNCGTTGEIQCGC